MFDHGFPSDWSTLKKLIWLKAIIGGGGGGSGTWKTVSGAIVHVPDALASPVRELSVAVQSTDGVTGCKVFRTNKNMVDESIYSLGGYMTLDTDPSSVYYGFYGGSVANWYNAQVASDITKNPNGFGVINVTGTFGCGGVDSGSFVFRIQFFYEDGTYETTSNISVDLNEIKRVGRTSDPAKNCTAYYIRTSASASNKRGRIKDLIVSRYDGTDAVDYVAPVRSETPISWQTEAGSITSGTLTVAGDGGVTLTSGGNTYQLASITPISTIAGENNIWADCGDTEVTYLASGNSSDLNAAESMNLLMGGAYQRSALGEGATDQEALDIIMGEAK